MMRRSCLIFTPARHRAFFPLPCVTDAPLFVGLVRKRAAELESCLLKQALANASGLQSRAFEKDAREQARAKCAALSTLRVREVEEAIFEKYGLTDERAVTCLVPYQLGANIILSRLPGDIRAEAIAELKSEEEALKKQGADKRIVGAARNKWIGWFEQDLYLADGTNYLKRIDSRRKDRVPIFAVMGHVNHGKTTLLDALQDSGVAETEAHGITQTVRAFTTTHPQRRSELFTFMDVPGHKVFVETRFHAQRAADCLLLVLSVTEGIQSQTHEAVKVALNLDKPIIVVFNKLDQLSDPFTAQQRVQGLLRELSVIGLDVTIVERESDLDHNSQHTRGGGETTPGTGSVEVSVPSDGPFTPAETHLLPVKRMDPTYKGSGYRPVLDLRRTCYGVCISATRRVNFPILWRLMCEYRDIARPSCHSNTATWGEHNGAVQALVVESSKHLFDEEGFRHSKARQRIQRGLDHAESRKCAKRDAMNAAAKMNASLHSGFRQYKKDNRTSTRSLIISVLVKEGVLSRGMLFVADQAEGRVDHLIDYWGNLVDHALPGMAVTIVDTNSASGCPGPGIHVLSVIDDRTQLAIYGYRQRLQWYLELFTKKLHYLKPRGMDVRFAHLGDYGQLEATHTLEYQLLYGAPPPPSAEEAEAARLEAGRRGQQEPQQRQVLGDTRSLGEYLAELNGADEAQVRAQGGVLAPGSGVAPQPHRLSSPGAGRITAGLSAGALATATLPSARGLQQQQQQSQSQGKRVTQGLVLAAEEEALDHSWRALQPKQPITSAEAFDRHMRQCIQVGVLLKVDNYHTARMLTREIPRLGTGKVAFQVLGVRFGPLTKEDVTFFSQAVKVIVCFRNPYAPSSELDHCIEINDQWVLHTDHFADIIAFAKWCAVALHKEYHANDGTLSDKRLYVPDDVDDGGQTATGHGSGTRAIGGAPDSDDNGGGGDDDKGEEEGEGNQADQPKRRKKLLLFNTGTD